MDLICRFRRETQNCRRGELFDRNFLDSNPQPRSAITKERSARRLVAPKPGEDGSLNEVRLAPRSIGEAGCQRVSNVFLELQPIFRIYVFESKLETVVPSLESTAQSHELGRASRLPDPPSLNMAESYGGQVVAALLKAFAYLATFAAIGRF
jgi:hypothetical protein